MNIVKNVTNIDDIKDKLINKDFVPETLKVASSTFDPQEPLEDREVDPELNTLGEELGDGRASQDAVREEVSLEALVCL